MRQRYSLSTTQAAKVAKWIKKDAAKIIARRGQYYQVTSSGQTVMLGGWRD